MVDHNISLADAIKAAKAAEKEALEAEKRKQVAEELVASVRSAESKVKIMKALDEVMEYAKSIGEFDNELQKDVKTKLRSIIKTAFGNNWTVNRKSLAKTMPVDNDTVVNILVKAGAKDKDSAISRSRIEKLIVAENPEKEFGTKFDNNSWSKRDTKRIKSVGEAKNKCYYTD